MDYDSSTKFISSLAKFLQSLCNGYVEFDNGVEVIGHIYLSVDTGKKIDYILNEKVCKTHENSVTFISNSFHAQPAEKPIPGQKDKNEQSNDKPSEEVVEVEKSNHSQVEPHSTNKGTVSNRIIYSSSPSLGKRPISPSQSNKQGQNSKRSRHNPPQHGLASNENNIATAQSSGPDPLRGHSQNSSVPPSHSSNHPSHSSNHPPQSSFNQSYATDNSNPHPADPEERDIKPTVDTDVTFVKEEFTQDSSSRSQGMEESFSSVYHSNQSYQDDGGQLNQYGDQSEFYDPGNSMASQDGNDDGTDPSAFVDFGSLELIKITQSHPNRPMLMPKEQSRLLCSECGTQFKHRHHLIRHKRVLHGWNDPENCYKCGPCCVMFARKDAYLRHLRSKMHLFYLHTLSE